MITGIGAETLVTNWSNSSSVRVGE